MMTDTTAPPSYSSLDLEVESAASSPKRGSSTTPSNILTGVFALALVLASSGVIFFLRGHNGSSAPAETPLNVKSFAEIAEFEISVNSVDFDVSSTSTKCQDGSCYPSLQQIKIIKQTILDFILYCEVGDTVLPLDPYQFPESDCLSLLVRMPFHDAMSYSSPRYMDDNAADPNTGTLTGGAHACLLVECTGDCYFTDPENAGMGPMSIALKNLYYHNGFDEILSLADFVVMAGEVALYRSGGQDAVPPETFGRVDCPRAFADVALPISFVGPPVENSINFLYRLPMADQNIEHVDFVFRQRNSFAMTIRNVVSVIGCHTLGRMYQGFSGFAGFWNNHPNRLNNEYFVDMWNMKWVRDNVVGLDGFPNGKIQWIRRQDYPIETAEDWTVYNHGFLHTDMALAFDLTKQITAPNPNPKEVWCGNCVLGGDCGLDCTYHLPSNGWYQYAVTSDMYANANAQWLSDLRIGWSKMVSLGTGRFCDSAILNDYRCFPGLKHAGGQEVLLYDQVVGNTSPITQEGVPVTAVKLLVEPPN